MLCAKIIEIGSSLLNFFKIKLVTFSRHAVDTVCTIPKQGNRHGGARAVDPPDGSFDLARTGVAPPLFFNDS